MATPVLNSVSGVAGQVALFELRPPCAARRGRAQLLLSEVSGEGLSRVIGVSARDKGALDLLFTDRPALIGRVQSAPRLGDRGALVIAHQIGAAATEGLSMREGGLGERAAPHAEDVVSVLWPGTRCPQGLPQAPLCCLSQWGGC